MGLGEYNGEYPADMATPPTWLAVLAAVPILLTLLLLAGFAWKEWREGRRMRSSPVHAAAWAMDPDELDRAIRALGARERELLEAGDVAAADAVAADMLICVAVSERRDGSG